MALLSLLVASIAFIVIATAKLGLHPFLALLIAAIGFGLLAGMPAAAVIEADQWAPRFRQQRIAGNNRDSTRPAISVEALVLAVENQKSPVGTKPTLPGKGAPKTPGSGGKQKGRTGRD